MAYQHTFALLGRSARIDLRQPWKQATWEGLLAGAPAEVEREGWDDSTIRFSMLVLGGPPLAGAEYAAYRAAARDETIVGLALAVDLPTGEYMSDKLQGDHAHAGPEGRAQLAQGAFSRIDRRRHGAPSCCRHRPARAGGAPSCVPDTVTM